MLFTCPIGSSSMGSMVVNSHVTFSNVLTLWIFHGIFIVFMYALHYRNPYDRLVSAYKDKALRNDPGIGIYTKHYKSPCKWQTDKSPLLTFSQVCVLAGGSPGPQTSIEICEKLEHLAIHYIVHIHYCFTIREVVTTALYCKHWSYLPGQTATNFMWR